jgi:hypothetical protein
MTTAWDGNQVALAAKEFCSQAEKKDKSIDSIVWHLEAAAAHRTAGSIQESNRHLDRAIAQMDQYEEKAKVKVGEEAAAIMSNQQNLAYEGRSYDKIMAHTYKALNLMTLGKIEEARPEIIRTYQRQQDAVEENKRRIEETQLAVEENKNKQFFQKSKDNPMLERAVEVVTKDTEGFRFYADYVNPFSVYLEGLYFLYTGSDGADLERARKAFGRVEEVVGDNKFIKADIEAAEEAIKGNTPSPTTYVIFETGHAASRTQVRIDIPIIVTSVSYVGVAFPKLVFRNDHEPGLLVRAGSVEETTSTVANMDAIIALDFKNEWPTILTKTVLSSVAKAAVAYAVNEAARRQSDLARLLVRVATAAAQAAVNIADTRGWTTLPKEFQVARIFTPEDRKILIGCKTGDQQEVVVDEGVVNVVYVRSLNVRAPLMVQQFRLK